LSAYPERASLRELFLLADKRPEVYFYTSSIEKFLQANILFKRSGLPLKQFRGNRKPYFEDYSSTKENLLAGAIREVTETIGHRSLIFFEDTSVRIDALSDSGREIPGMRVKEWFAETSFDDLDTAIKQGSGSRRCAVQSDIALHIPHLGRPLFFHSETIGAVAETAPAFKASEQFPWLSPTNFNGWFIPDGATKRLGEMSFDEAFYFDFRIRALSKLVDYLEELSAALNLPPSSYVRHHAPLEDPNVPLFRAPAYLVLGATCAGKTTFAERLETRHDATLVEASSVVRMCAKKHGINEESDFRTAERLLNEYGTGLVAETILEAYPRSRNTTIVVSGFRAIEELRIFQGGYPDGKVVLIEANDRIRFSRNLARARRGYISSFTEFQKLDDDQRRMGLLPVVEEFANFKIQNDGTMDEFLNTVDSIATGNEANAIDPKTHATALQRSQLTRSLRVLAATTEAMTTADIGALAGESGSPIRHNNVNKILKRYPELVERVDEADQRVKYRILEPGREYLTFVDQLLLERDVEAATGSTPLRSE